MPALVLAQVGCHTKLGALLLAVQAALVVSNVLALRAGLDSFLSHACAMDGMHAMGGDVPKPYALNNKKGAPLLLQHPCAYSTCVHTSISLDPTHSNVLQALSAQRAGIRELRIMREQGGEVGA